MVKVVLMDMEFETFIDEINKPKLKGVVFDVTGNASKMAVCFKINVERCSASAGR